MSVQKVFEYLSGYDLHRKIRVLNESSATVALAAQALEQLSSLRGCEAHSSVILSPVDSVTYGKLGMHLTCEPQYETNKLYRK